MLNLGDRWCGRQHGAWCMKRNSTAPATAAAAAREAAARHDVLPKRRSHWSLFSWRSGLATIRDMDTGTINSSRPEPKGKGTHNDTKRTQPVHVCNLELCIEDRCAEDYCRHSCLPQPLALLLCTVPGILCCSTDDTTPDLLYSKTRDYADVCQACNACSCRAASLRRHASRPTSTMRMHSWTRSW